MGMQTSEGTSFLMVQFVFRPKIKHEELFARQYEPPLEFPLTLPFSGTVKYVSGPTHASHSKPLSKSRSVPGTHIQAFTFTALTS